MAKHARSGQVWAVTRKSWRQSWSGASRPTRAASGVAVYFCDPQSPWQRGSNENTNGLLRQYFPKGESLEGISQERVDEVAEKLDGPPARDARLRNPGGEAAELIDSLEETGAER